MAENKNLLPIHAGSDQRYKLTFVDEDGVAIDVTGDKLYMTIKSDLSLADNDAEMQSSVVIPAGADATAGIAYLDLADTETDITPGRYHYDTQWVRTISGSGEIETTWYGEISVLQRATRATT